MKEQDPDPDRKSLVRIRHPWIRICNKMSRIHNTGDKSKSLTTTQQL